MFLNCFRCEQRNRKQVVFDPNIDSTDIEGPNIDDTAPVPSKGFLASSNIRLPTYQSKDAPRQRRSRTDHVRLSFRDVLSAMRIEAHLARCILFETARLQNQSPSARSLKLSEDARMLDIQLLELEKVLLNGNELIRVPRSDKHREKQNLIIKGKPFRKSLRMKLSFLSILSSYFVLTVMDDANNDGGIIGRAKRSLMELEKSFDEEIMSELKNGMQREESVDHKQVDEKVTILISEFQKVYKEVKAAYNSEKKKQGRDRRAEPESSGANQDS